MIELIFALVGIAIGCLATFAWINEKHALALWLFTISGYIIYVSTKSACGG